MGLDEELEEIEDGVETEAEEVDQDPELLDVEEYQDDEEFDPNADDSDLEDAYEGFFAEEGPDGEGETSLAGDGGLAAAVEEIEGVDLSEEGFHLVDGDESDLEAALDEEGTIDDYDADELDDELMDVDEGTLADVEAADELEEIEDDQEADLEDEEDEEQDEDYEIVELELDEDDIVRYLEDEEGNRIGFVLLEDGEEAEYYYVEEDDEDEEEDNPFDLGITKEGVAAATSDMNAIYKDGVAVAAELKGALDDIKSAFDFTSFLKK